MNKTQNDIAALLKKGYELVDENNHTIKFKQGWVFVDYLTTILLGIIFPIVGAIGYYILWHLTRKTITIQKRRKK